MKYVLNAFSFTSFWEIFSVFLSICALAYTIYANRVLIDATEFNISKNREHYYFSFRLLNTSSRSAKITKIEFYKDSEKIDMLSFDPIDYDDKLAKIKSDEWDKIHKYKLQNYLLYPNEIFEVKPSFGRNLFTKYPDIYKPVFPIFLSPGQQNLYSFYVSNKPNKMVVHIEKPFNFFNSKTFKF